MREITKYGSVEVGDILKWEDKRKRENLYITIVIEKNKDSIIEILYAVKSKGLIKVRILEDKNEKIPQSDNKIKIDELIKEFPKLNEMQYEIIEWIKIRLLSNNLKYGN